MLAYGFGLDWQLHLQRLEVAGITLSQPEFPELALQQKCQRMNAACDRLQAIRSVIHAVHRRHIGQQRLGGADIRRRLLPPDVLFTSRERHPIRGSAVCVDRYADDSAGHLTDERASRREERGVRPAVAERDAEAL